MSALTKRLAKLEGTTATEDLVVVIQRFGPGEYDRVKGEHGQMVLRLPKESEEAFLERARNEIVSAIKNEVGMQPCYVLQPLRENETELQTALQVRPTVTRDEWLIAHGLEPIADQPAEKA
jgi:hypothetical protein